MIQTLFSIDAFVHNVKEWNKKKKILSGFIEKQEYFRRPNTNFDTTRYGKGILYLNLAKEQDTTTYISPSPSEISGATRLVKIEAKEGSLVVFPGHLLHFVDPNPINKERIVVSFDINCYPK